MRLVTSLFLESIEKSIIATPAGSRKIAIARSLIAGGQLSILIFTNWKALFVPTGDNIFGPKCDGISSIGAYCLMFDKFGINIPSIVVIFGLLFILSGFFPRYAGIIHVWVTISISASIKLPDGGESVAQIIVLLLALVSLSDNRLNHWQKDSSRYSPLLPITWAASHLIRYQIIWVYMNAAIAKTEVPEWKDGTAVYYITLDPMFGTSGILGSFFDWIVNIPFLSLAMTWGAIIIELSIAFMLLKPARYRFVAFWLSVCLHSLFILMIGLWSFALVMIGSALAATGPTIRVQNMWLALNNKTSIK